MDDRVAQLRRERDAIANGIERERAEIRRRLAESKAAGKKAGEAWAGDPAHDYTRLKRLAEERADAITGEVWSAAERDGFTTSEARRSVGDRMSCTSCYQHGFLEAVTEMLRKVEEDKTARPAAWSARQEQ